MNARILWLGAAALVSFILPSDASEPTPLEAREVTIDVEGSPVGFAYRLLRPAACKPGVRYPVILFLHGAGERGDDNERQVKFLPTWMAEPRHRDTYPCFLVAPQCRTERSWSRFDWDTKQAAPFQTTPTPDMAAAIAALEAVLATEPCEPARVYLTGLSMGGYGSWDLAARMPDRFAAVVTICGGGDEATAPRLADLPLWCFHGTDDPLVPVELSRSMIAAVRAAGGVPVYSELAGVGHDSWTPAYRNPALLDWLFAQRRRSAADAGIHSGNSRVDR